MYDDTPLTAHSGATEELTALREADVAAHRHVQEWEARLEDMWGPEPPYTPQPEDGSSWFFGSFFYTWIGRTMIQASEETLTTEELPGPMQRVRAYATGRLLSREIQRQRTQRGLWASYIGRHVALKGRGSGRGAGLHEGWGRLLYVGPVRQLTGDSGELFAGVAWPSLGAVPLRRRRERRMGEAFKPGCLMTSGVVDGEELFTLGPGEAFATIERLCDIAFVLADHTQLAGVPREERSLVRKLEADDIPVPARLHTPKPYGIGKALVYALGHVVLPAVPWCIISKGLTLISPIVLQAYVSYMESAIAAQGGGGGGGAVNVSAGMSVFGRHWAVAATHPLNVGGGNHSSVDDSSSSSYLFSSSTSSFSSSASADSGSGSGSGAPGDMPPTLAYGLLLAALLFVIPLAEAIASNRFSFLTNRVTYVWKNAIIAQLFEKCLTVSSKALSDPTMSAGRLVNMMGSDVSRISSMAMMFWSLLSAPFMLAGAMYLLYQLIGWAAIVGACVLVLFMPVQGFIMVFMFRTFRAKAKATDARLRATNEFLAGIRVTKFMSWEPSFVVSIEEKRKEELRQLRNIQHMYMIISFFMNAAPSVVIASVFFTYSAMGHELTPSVVFPVITLLWVLETPFFIIPMGVQMVLRAAVSIRRINRFLECEDTDPGRIADILCDIERGEESTTTATNTFTFPPSSSKSGATGTNQPQGQNQEQQEKREAQLADRETDDECWRQTTAVWFRHANLTAYAPTRLTDPKALRKEEKEGIRAGRNGTAQAEQPADSTQGDAQQEQQQQQPSGAPRGPPGADDENAFYNLAPKNLLTDVSLRVPRGKLTVVVGATGSGKSTLLDSLIGAVDVTSGRVLASRSVAYVPQQPWIMNATVRENVLFFSEMEGGRFERALDCSQLRSDLALLAGGLETEIGEKGINLSGGQKARVSLARAVYADRELYLLDDPLSALDAHVGDKVMRECVLGELRGKTRILATHHVHVVNDADLVVLLEEGRVVFSGTPEEFSQRGLAARVASRRNSAGNSSIAGSRTERQQSFQGGSHSLRQREGDDSGNHTSTDGGVAGASTETDDPQSSTTAGEKKLSAPDDIDTLARQVSEKFDDGGSTGPTGASTTATPREEGEHATSAGDAASPAAAAQGKLLSEEEMAQGAVSFRVYARYVDACGGWAVCGAVIFLYVATEVLNVGPYLWLSVWSTDAFGLSTERYIAIYALLTLGDTLCSPIRYLSLVSACRRAGRRLHSRLLRSIACGTLQFFDTTPTGRIINRFSRDMEQLDDDLPGDISYLLFSLCSLFSSMMILVSSQYLVLLLIAPLSFAYLRLMRFYNAAKRHLQRTANVSHSSVFSILTETLGGRWTIAAYGKGHAVMAKALKSLDRIYASGFMVVVGNKWLSVRIEALATLLTASVATLGVVALHVPWIATSHVGLLSLALIMAWRLSRLMNAVVMQVASVEADMNAVERVDAYIAAIAQEDGTLATLEKEVVELRRRQRQLETEAPVGVQEENAVGGESLDVEEGEEESESAPLLIDSAERPTEERTVRAASAPVRAGTIEFAGVDMRYRPGLPLVLRGVSFRVGAGEKVGVVGRTGSGKSTLLLAFLRLVEVCGGEVRVCGRAAVDYDLRALRRLFSMIPQDPLLFDGTVRSNVDPFGEATDAACWAALGHVGMAARVRGEAGGLLGRVSEGGSNFSVGQRQLLCLARALLKKGSAFLLMDEATANVDPALDRQIQETVARTFRAYTVITIAHRLHTVAAYDTIVMMDGGRVVACGSPRALVSDAASPFAALVRSMGEEAQRKFMQAMK